MKSNIVLTGMPGVGKSTIGVLLAKACGKRFLDTDVYIQAIEGRGLQEIIDSEGLESFKRIEQEQIGCVDIKNAVIATGGSVVYSERAMNNLRSEGVIVHLQLGIEEIKKRVTDLSTRGLVMEPGEDLESLYAKRIGLYRRWADITVDLSGLDHQRALGEIIRALEKELS